jgi:hypothetical protein
MLDVPTMRSTLGSDFENSFTFLPAIGTRRGILLAVRELVYQLQNPILFANTISAIVFDLRTNGTLTITSVYGPQGELQKKCYLTEMKQIKNSALAKWLLIRDFNMIYHD